MAGLKIGRMMLGICQTNCYFVYKEGQNDVILFDRRTGGIISMKRLPDTI